MRDLGLLALLFFILGCCVEGLYYGASYQASPIQSMNAPETEVAASRSSAKTTVLTEDDIFAFLDGIIYEASQIELPIPLSDKEIQLQNLKDEIIAMAHDEKTKRIEDSQRVSYVSSIRGVCYVSDMNSKVFHRTSCRFAKLINNDIRFFSKKPAAESGRRPCKTCTP